jgi:hypothetical protein
MPKIYESPDRGKTVYGRELGSLERILEHGTTTINQIREDQLWGEIRQSAKTNSALQAALERAILIHQLSKDHGTK